MNVGDVYRLDPGTLVRMGATCNAPEANWVRGWHDFVYLGENRWSPLYSRGGLRRIAVPFDALISAPKKYLDGITYLRPDIWWTATDDQVDAAQNKDFETWRMHLRRVKEFEQMVQTEPTTKQNDEQEEPAMLTENEETPGEDVESLLERISEAFIRANEAADTIGTKLTAEIEELRADGEKKSEALRLRAERIRQLETDLAAAREGKAVALTPGDYMAECVAVHSRERKLIVKWDVGGQVLEQFLFLNDPALKDYVRNQLFSIGWIAGGGFDVCRGKRATVVVAPVEGDRLGVKHIRIMQMKNADFEADAIKLLSEGLENRAN